MNHLPFILGAYAAAFVGTVVLTWVSYRSMRKAESDADDLRRER